MKAFRLLTMAMLCTAITLVSCSGEDGKDGLPGEDGAQGAQGVAGADGADGADGISCWDLNGNGMGDAAEDINNDGNFDALDCQGADGADGANGLDGNANVQRADVLVQDFSGSNLTLDLTVYTGIALQDLPNYAFFFYLTTTPNNVVYPVPGPMNANQFYSRVFYSYDSGNVSVLFYDTSTDNAFDVPLGTFGNFSIIAIEAPLNSKNASESVASQLKAAGVDTNDYHAMVEYLGLE